MGNTHLREYEAKQRVEKLTDGDLAQEVERITNKPRRPSYVNNYEQAVLERVVERLVVLEGVSRLVRG